MQGCTRSIYQKAVSGKSITDLEKFVSKHPTHLLADSAKLYIDVFTWENTVKKHTIEVYNDYIKNYPNGKYLSSAKDSIEILIWKDAIQKNEIPTYESYLKSYPQGKFLSAAKNSIETLVWKDAIQKNQITTYQVYLKSYPQGKYLSAAKNSIETLVWKDAIQKNEIPTYENYLKSYPQGKYFPSAKDSIETLVWKVSIQKNEISSYESYIGTYPQGKYLSAAKDSIETLVWKEAILKNEITLFYNYLDTYPNGQFKQKAKSYIAQFAPDINEWESTKRNNKLSKSFLENYLRKFPKGGYVEEAKCRLKIFGLNCAFGIIADISDITEDQVKTYIEDIENETYVTIIDSPVTYYRVSGTRCNETTVKTKKMIEPNEIGKACSLQLELGELSITAFYISNPTIKHPLFVEKRNPTMTHNGCSGPGLEMERTAKSESFLKTFSIEYHLIASSDVNFVIPDLIWGADETAGYGHNGEIFEKINDTIKIEGLKCDIAKLPKSIMNYKMALEIKTFIKTFENYQNKTFEKKSSKPKTAKVKESNFEKTKQDVVMDIADDVKEVNKESEKTYTVIEQMPQFPGGEQALLNFINKNLKYPENAQKNGMQGKVILRFVVTKTGNVDRVEVVRSVHRDLDNEAIRVVKLLPKFIPGKQNGVNVSVWYTIPIDYKLE